MDSKKRDLILAQLEKSEEKLEAARTLLKEGFIDDAISRVYYSADYEKIFSQKR